MVNASRDYDCDDESCFCSGFFRAIGLWNALKMGDGQTRAGFVWCSYRGRLSPGVPLANALWNRFAQAAALCLCL